MLASCHLKNYFCYHLPTRGRAGVKLGCWYVANVSIIFDAPCLFYTNYLMFYLSFGVLFMHFLELTYWQDATVPVPIFCCFWFQKSCTGNILEIGWNKSRSSYFHETKTESEGETKWGHRVATPPLGAARPGPTPRHGVGPPSLRWPCPSACLFSVTGKPWTPEHNSMKSSVAAAIANPSSGGFWSSSRHSAGEGNHTGGILHHHAGLRGDAWVVHLRTTGP